MIWWLHSRPFSRDDFQPERWSAGLAASQDGECVRGRMARNIIDTVVLPGSPRSYVEAVLGSPQDTEDNLASYDLGMCSGFGIDYDSLKIEYKAGKVVRAYHVQN
ncbi:hypothetical protein NYR97_06105 [Xanthomonas hydrangeae]|uniref:Bacterial EndoU nuclease domain-containing protein n=1 Tax=Xanthomonas hydrangeae TaxID=2775159 RepID=A0AAU0BD18_9XANT|nr:hypothetical protein [Xanthomonas hydrangeae]WOB50953.1 hypothetical protein NYR97_06105 [Xanthomonas hydrangeae]